MKEVILGLGMSFILILSLLTFSQLDQYREQRVKLKGVSEEVAASAAQYFSRESFADGYFNFNQMEGNKAASYTLRSHLNLNADFSPKLPNYWIDSEKIKYEITYIDYSNYESYLTNPLSYETAFPNEYTFTQLGETFTTILFGPSTIVSINAGKPNYTVSFLEDTANNVIEHGVHTLEE